MSWNAEMFTIVTEVITWLFWQSIWQVEQVAKNIFVAILPLSLIKAEAIKKFEELGVKTSFPGDPDIGKYDKKKYHCEIVVHNPKFFRAIAFDDALSLGEAYMVSGLCTRLSFCVLPLHYKLLIHQVFFMFRTIGTTATIWPSISTGC